MDDELARFMDATGAGPDQAQFFLEACGGNYERALSMFYGEQLPAGVGQQPAAQGERGKAARLQTARPCGGGSGGAVARPASLRRLVNCAAHPLTLALGATALPVQNKPAARTGPTR